MCEEAEEKRTNSCHDSQENYKFYGRIKLLAN